MGQGEPLLARLSTLLRRRILFPRDNAVAFGSRSISSTMEPTKAARPAMPEWLSRALQDRSAGPRIYRWTTDDIAGASKAAPVAADISKRSGDDARQRIYILGMGNLGRLFAASLARLPNRPPITLVVHRPGLLEQWRAEPGVVLHPPRYLEGGARAGESARIADFDVEMWSETPPPAAVVGGGASSSAAAAAAEIRGLANLIIATKAQDAVRTAEWLRRYLGPDSVVAFAQNGMNKLWPPYGAIYNAARYPQDAATKSPSNPLWLACIVTHGVFSLGPFASVHASPASVVLGAVGDVDPFVPGEGAGTVQGPYLVETILAASQLNARWAPRPELWVLQLEKLVVNAVVNPLTAILRCKNGALFVSEGEADGADALVPRIIDQLLQEASVVLRALARQEIQSGTLFGQTASSSLAAFVERLSFSSLRSMVYDVGKLIKDNNSSMLQDVLAGKKTEVGEFNGWVVEMARYLESVGATDGKIDVAGHQIMVDLVEKRVPLSKGELGKYFLQ